MAGFAATSHSRRNQEFLHNPSHSQMMWKSIDLSQMSLPRKGYEQNVIW